MEKKENDNESERASRKYKNVSYSKLYKYNNTIKGEELLVIGKLR